MPFNVLKVCEIMYKYMTITMSVEQYIVEFLQFRAYYISVKFGQYIVSFGRKYILFDFFVTSIL